MAPGPHLATPMLSRETVAGLGRLVLPYAAVYGEKP